MPRSRFLVKLRWIAQYFWFLPSVLGLAGLALAAFTIWLDRTEPGLLPFLSNIGPVTSRSVLETTATAVVTIISLTYSLTLVVFTLATGNIAPRLMARFRESTLTRLSIGMFSSTFLFAITVLVFVGDESAPRLSAVTALVLAIASVYVLILYVNHVSSQVIVDNEIALASNRAHAAIEDLIEEEGGKEDREHDIPRDRPKWILHAPESGYVREVDALTLVEIASGSNCFIDLRIAPGDFLVEGIAIAEIYGSCPEDSAEAILNALIVGPSRMPEGDPGFLIHLVIEIALRALSPGVNDSYTAISCIDNLSAIFAKMLQGETPPAIHLDKAGTPRLHFEAMSVEDILEKSLRPLRISSRNNLPVTLRLLLALQHMAQFCLPQYRGLVRMHADMVIADARDHVTNAQDFAEVQKLHDRIIETLEKGGEVVEPPVPAGPGT